MGFRSHTSAFFNFVTIILCLLIVRFRARWHEHGEKNSKCFLNIEKRNGVKFPLNKVPGNDGLQVEFYKTFWASVGKLLGECLNESFEKGETNSLQKQAVLTFIEKKKTKIVVILKIGGQSHF